MSNLVNRALRDYHYRKGMELGIKRGLAGTELEEFAFQHMQKEMKKDKAND